MTSRKKERRKTFNKPRYNPDPKKRPFLILKEYKTGRNIKVYAEFLAGKSIVEHADHVDVHPHKWETNLHKLSIKLITTESHLRYFMHCCAMGKEVDKEVLKKKTVKESDFRYD